MTFFTQILDNVPASSDLLNFIGILTTVIASIYIFKKETSVSFTRECHDKIIFPLFNLLEPVLYCDFSSAPLEDALRIVEENRNLADGKLLEISYLCSNFPSQKNFNKLCKYVDKLYDKSCRQLGLKTRSVSYRITRNQYSHIGYLVIYAVLSSLLAFTAAIAIFFVFLCGITLLFSLYDSANVTTRLVILMVAVILGLAFVKYINKHY